MPNNISLLAKTFFGILLITAISLTAVLFFNHKKDQGQVLGAEETVRMEVPEMYNEPLVLNWGKKYLSITPLNGNPVPVDKVDQRYIYRSAYRYTDVVQTEYEYKIKEQLILRRPGHPVNFKYRLGNVGAFKVEKDSEGNIIFYDPELYDLRGPSALARVFTIPTPFIEDANHNRSFQAVDSLVAGDELIVSIDIDWLSQAAYPVVLDPTIEISFRY